MMCSVHYNRIQLHLQLKGAFPISEITTNRCRKFVKKRMRISNAPIECDLRSSNKEYLSISLFEL